jgi:hypothetical protein
MVKKKLLFQREFPVVLKPLDNWERWQKLNDDKWVMDFINGFVLHNNDKKEESWQKRQKKVYGASLDKRRPNH